MRVSLAWLKEYVAIDVGADKLAHLLSFSGLKVESITRPGRSIGGVVVAEVLNIEEHPNADNLMLVDVRTDDGDARRVVCGARNFYVGDRVPLATVGARLGDLQITERSIRGQVSDGMLCSAAELGLSKDHSGILVLPPDAPLGEDIVALLELNDAILELEVTPNRPDCLGMIGVAREVSALLGNELSIPEVRLGQTDALDPPVAVEIDDPAGCRRYVARYLDGVDIRPSPGRIAMRLMALGFRPISNVVDATNYVLLETGQPLHAFDAAKVHDQRIVVRRAKKGERLLTLDGVERALDPADIVIADRKKPLALAGVMGGEESEVSDTTSSIIIESAYFDPASIAFTNRRHLLRTEASARFSGGVDPEMVPFAAARVASLIVQHAGGRPASGAVDAYPNPFERRHLTLRPTRTDALLGFSVAAPTQASLLRSVGFEVGENDHQLEVEVPSFRWHDVTREIDLVEEVARLSGYERLVSTLPAGGAGGLDPIQSAERNLRTTLAGYGLREAWTSAFQSDHDLDALGLPPESPLRTRVEIANPMNEEEEALRTTMIAGLLRSAARNFAHNAHGVALFEVGRIYEPRARQVPEEASILALLLAGHRDEQSWTRPTRRWDFFAAKGLIEASAASLGWPELSFTPTSGMPLHPSRAAIVSASGLPIGVLGELHPEVCERFDVPEGAVAGELALVTLLEPPAAKTIAPLRRFPAVYLDIAVVVDEETPAGEVAATIRTHGAPELVVAKLFDVYRGEQVSEGKKSLAFSLELRDADRTLTDADANAVRDRIVAELASRFGATLRG